MQKRDVTTILNNNLTSAGVFNRGDQMINCIKRILNRFTYKENDKISIFNKEIEISDKQKKILFDSLMNYATSVIQKHENRSIKYDQIDEPERHPIYNTIKLIGLRLQTKYITNLLYHTEGYGRLPNIDAWHQFFSISDIIEKSNGKKMYDYFINMPIEDEVISLRDDLVLPWPWNRGRHLDSLVNIGKGRFWGDWKYKSDNHNVEFWLPLRIGFVNGGNHSISAGILSGGGQLKPRDVLDISPIYDHVYTDGVNYYRKFDDSIISKTLSVEFAALFEIGRLMKDNNIA